MTVTEPSHTTRERPSDITAVMLTLLMFLATAAGCIQPEEGQFDSNDLPGDGSVGGRGLNTGVNCLEEDDDDDDHDREEDEGYSPPPGERRRLDRHASRGRRRRHQPVRGGRRGAVRRRRVRVHDRDVLDAGVERLPGDAAGQRLHELPQGVLVGGDGVRRGR